MNRALGEKWENEERSVIVSISNKLLWLEIKTKKPFSSESRSSIEESIVLGEKWYPVRRMRSAQRHRFLILDKLVRLGLRNKKNLFERIGSGGASCDQCILEFTFCKYDPCDPFFCYVCRTRHGQQVMR